MSFASKYINLKHISPTDLAAIEPKPEHRVEWYDLLGMYWDGGVIQHPAIPFEDALDIAEKKTTTEAAVSRILEELKETRGEAATLSLEIARRRIAVAAVEYATQAALAANAIYDGIEKAIEAHRKGDYRACIEALEQVGDVENDFEYDYKDDPIAQSWAEQLLNRDMLVY
jgi:hypothetical protein